MARKETLTGKIAKTFDGEIKDKDTGEVKTYSPSITLTLDETFDTVKVRCSHEDVRQAEAMIGQTITMSGVCTKLAAAAEFNGMISTAKPAAK